MSGRAWSLLLAPAQLVDLLLHVGELPAQLVEVVSRGSGFFLSRSRLVVTAREGREHRERALEHLHVAANLLIERPERAHPESLRHLITELLLLARKRLDRGFQIARHQH